METASMANPAESLCPSCGATLPEGARRCDTCGSAIMETDVAGLEAFVGILKGNRKPSKKPSTPRPRDPNLAKGAATGRDLHLCPSCGAFVGTEDAKCGQCGIRFDEERTSGSEDRAIPALCPECGSLAPTGQQTCAVCGTSLRAARAQDHAEPVIPEAPEVLPPSDEPPKPRKVRTRSSSPVEVEPPTPPPPPPTEHAPDPQVLGPPSELGDAQPEPPPPELFAAASRPTSRNAVRATYAAVRIGPGESPRFDQVRELSAIGTVLALSVTAIASLLMVPGQEYGQLFLFGTLFGVGASLTLPGLRGLPGRWGTLLAFTSGTLLLASAPVLGYAGAGSAEVGGALLLIGLVALGFAAWRTIDSVGLSLLWVAGLLLLSVLAISPIAFVSPGATATAQWAIGGGLALGTATYATIQRVLRQRADARLRRGDEEYARKEFDKAIASYDAAIRLGRRARHQDPAYWYGKGAALISAGKYDEAIAALDRSLAISPENEVAWINKGAALARLGRLNDALKCYNSAIKANPTYEVAWNNKGNALARLERPELALACYERALELDASYRTAWVNKGFVLTKLGRFEEAADCADTALRLTNTGAASS